MKIQEHFWCPDCGGAIRGFTCVNCGFRVAMVGDKVYDFQPRIAETPVPFQLIESKRKRLESDPFSRLLVSTVREFVANAKGVFVDVGCGTGYYSQEIFRFSAVGCVGVDLRHAFDTANASDKYCFARVDFFSRALKAGAFDGVVSFDVIEHVEDDSRFLRRCIEVTRVGGVVVIGTPNLNRITSSVRSVFKGKRAFPFDYGTDAVLGDTVHLREYGYNELVSLLGEFRDEVELHVEPLLLGIRLPGLFRRRMLGDEHPRGWLGKRCAYWLVVGTRTDGGGSGGRS